VDQAARPPTSRSSKHWLDYATAFLTLAAAGAPTFSAISISSSFAIAHNLAPSIGKAPPPVSRYAFAASLARRTIARTTSAVRIGTRAPRRSQAGGPRELPCAVRRGSLLAPKPGTDDWSRYPARPSRKANEARAKTYGPHSTSKVCREFSRMRGGLLRSSGLDEPKLAQRGHAIIEPDLLDDPPVDHLQHRGAGEVHLLAGRRGEAADEEVIEGWTRMRAATFPLTDDIVALGDKIGGAPEIEIG